MRWFRMNGGWTVRLALLALAVQLAVSFGHVHVPHLEGGTAAGTVVPAPADGDGPQHPGPDDCAICAVMHLAGSLALPEPVVLATPALVRIAWPAAMASPVRATHRDHFRARGPPQA